jgi:hypothetical protein
LGPVRTPIKRAVRRLSVVGVQVALCLDRIAKEARPPGLGIGGNPPQRGGSISGRF